MGFVFAIFSLLIISIWMTIFLITLVAACMRNAVKKQSYVVWKHFVFRGEDKLSIMLDKLLECTIFLWGGIFILIFVCHFPHELVWGIVGCCKTSVIISFIPVILQRERDEKFQWDFWSIMVIIIGLLLTIVSFMIQETDIGTADTVFALFLTLFVSFIISVVLAVYYIFKINRTQYNLERKNAWKDLDLRTSVLNVYDRNKNELSRTCEKVFSNHKNNICKRKRKIECITFGTSLGTCRGMLLKRAIKGMTILICISVLIEGLGFVIFPDGRKQVFLFLIFFIVCIVGFFCLLVVDKEYCIRITIRLLYDEWGYWIETKDKTKFVGNWRMIPISSNNYFRKVVLSLLDISAVCRSVSFSDIHNSGQGIEFVADNMYSMCMEYTDNKEREDYVVMLPLWIAALFEFSVHGTVSNKISACLNSLLKDKETRSKIEAFIYSFWVDMTRRMPNLEDTNIVLGFFCEIEKGYGECSNTNTSKIHEHINSVNQYIYNYGSDVFGKKRNDVVRSQIIKYCLTFENVYEDYPFCDNNWTVMCHKSNNKVFAWIFERKGHIWIKVKCDREGRDFRCGAFKSVFMAYHLSKKHWKSVILDGSIPEEDVNRMIRESYELTAEKG